MENKGWVRKSIFEKISFRMLMLFCSLVILSNIISLFYFLFGKIKTSFLSSWIPPIFATVFIIVGFNQKIKEEKIATVLFGLSFIVGWIPYFAKGLIIPSFIMSLTLQGFGTFNFWAAYKVFKKLDKKNRDGCP